MLSILGACAPKEKRWVKDGATPNQVKSALYWCQKVRREKFENFNARTPGRKSERIIDAECMRKRGFRYE